MLARVSNIEALRRWSNWQPLFDGDEEPTLEDLIRQITTDSPSEAMKAGTAFHKAIELRTDASRNRKIRALTEEIQKSREVET